LSAKEWSIGVSLYAAEVGGAECASCSMLSHGTMSSSGSTVPSSGSSAAGVEDSGGGEGEGEEGAAKS